MNLLPTNSLGGRFDCRYFAISCRLSAGSPPCVCYCATTYTLNWRRACFQTRTTRASNLGDRFDSQLFAHFPGSSAAAATHRFSLLFLTIFLLVPGSSATYPPLSAVFAAIFPGFPPVLRPACATARQRTPSTGGVPAFKPGPHVHPITDTQAVSTTWRPL